MSLRLRLAAGALALPLLGDEEADKLQTLNNLLGNRSRNQGLNRCVAWTATAKRVDRMKRRDALLRVPGQQPPSSATVCQGSMSLHHLCCGANQHQPSNFRSLALSRAVHRIKCSWKMLRRKIPSRRGNGGVAFGFRLG